MEMHAGAGIFLDRLGHEASGDAVAAGGGAHQPLQHDEVVGGLEHVLAVVERQLVLARRIFGDHRLGRDALRGSRRVDIGKQRLHAVQMVDRIDLGLAALAAVEHGLCRLHAAFGVALIGKQEELQLECAGRLQALVGKHRDLTRQRMARVRRHRLAVEVVHRHQHLAARRLRAEAAAPACRGSASRADRRRRNPRSVRSRGRPRR